MDWYILILVILVFCFNGFALSRLESQLDEALGILHWLVQERRKDQGSEIDAGFYPGKK